MQWQVQQAKQRFSELIRRAVSDGPQVVTRHGGEVVVVVSATQYHRMAGDVLGFKEFLVGPPYVEIPEVHRDSSPTRAVDFLDQAR
jgi:prevent-host-death family protein